ncbi:hypothetical protein [Novispirillum itersonii]|uniref:hypothetical protein n=1 Tax=Novispirillum itersonii TaxID=189 RepID=UPI00035C230B|nr:hypothetical protein [Novispirillum itersonii]
MPLYNPKLRAALALLHWTAETALRLICVTAAFVLALQWVALGYTETGELPVRKMDLLVTFQQILMLTLCVWGVVTVIRMLARPRQSILGHCVSLWRGEQS